MSTATATYSVYFKEPRPTAAPDAPAPNFEIVTPTGEFDLAGLTPEDFDWEAGVEWPWESEWLGIYFPETGENLELTLTEVEPDVLEVIWNIIQPT